jgi:hypothetical protein
MLSASFRGSSALPVATEEQDAYMLSAFQDALHMCGTQNSSSILGKAVVIIYKMWMSIDGATTAARVLQALKRYWATSMVSASSSFTQLQTPTPQTPVMKFSIKTEMQCAL